MDGANEAQPYGAYEGGAKVLNAIREVLDAGGSPTVALEHGAAALRDLRPKRPTDPGIPILRTEPGGNLDRGLLVGEE